MCFKMDAALCFFEGNFIYVECNLVFSEQVRNDGQKKNKKKREQKKIMIQKHYDRPRQNCEVIHFKHKFEVSLFILIIFDVRKRK